MEQNNTIICTECGTENEMKYLYCKNCGHRLHEEETGGSSNASPEGYFSHEQREPDAVNQNFSHNQQQSAADGAVPNPRSYSQNDYTYASGKSTYRPDYRQVRVEQIQGLPAEEISVFVGQAAPRIMPKFEKLEVTGRKISWCWPAAILGYLFGPIGAAMWFFYRKMYKIAVILAGIGAVCMLAVGIMTSNTALQVNGLLDGFMNQNGELTVGFAELLRSLFEQLSTSENVLSVMGSALDRTVNVAACVITGLFGHYWYLRHTVHSIRDYRQSCADPRYYQIGLLAVGGTSGGMLALGIGIYVVMLNLVSVVTGLIH